MIRERLFRPFAVLATKWKRSAFFAARVKLTAMYAATAAVLLSAFSYLLYGSLLTKFHELVEEQVFDPFVRQAVFEQATEALQTRILVADGIVLLVVIVLGYILTEMTLRPIKQALERERRFIADAAHELRTPLTAMKTEMEVALRGKDAMSSSVKGVLSSAVEEIDSLARIANGLIDVVRGQTKELEKTDVVIDELVRETAAKLRLLAEQKRITFTERVSDKPTIVKADRAALSGALYNVLHNAVLYTPEGGAITISATRHGRMCEIAVQDTGMGIAPDDLKHVFEPFYRADKAHAAPGGSGLGLAIVKATMERHAGDVVIKSAPGEGTCVTLTLPI